MKANICQNCEYYKIKLLDVKHVEGECFRFPPYAQILPSPQGPITATFWPGPRPAQSCGEYKIRL